jgi:hypothetical protein
MSKDYQSKRDEIRNNLLAAFAEPNDKLAYNGLDSTSQTDDVMQVVDSLVAEERQKERETLLGEIELRLLHTPLAYAKEAGDERDAWNTISVDEIIASQRNQPSEKEKDV